MHALALRRLMHACVGGMRWWRCDAALPVIGCNLHTYQSSDRTLSFISDGPHDLLHSACASQTMIKLGHEFCAADGFCLIYRCCRCWRMKAGGGQCWSWSATITLLSQRPSAAPRTSMPWLTMVAAADNASTAWNVGTPAPGKSSVYLAPAERHACCLQAVPGINRSSRFCKVLFVLSCNTMMICGRPKSRDEPFHLQVMPRGRPRAQDGGVPAAVHEDAQPLRPRLQPAVPPGLRELCPRHRQRAAALRPLCRRRPLLQVRVRS